MPAVAVVVTAADGASCSLGIDYTVDVASGNVVVDPVARYNEAKYDQADYA